MATVHDIGLAAAINIFSAFLFLILFAIQRLQPVNDSIFSKMVLQRDKMHSDAFRSFLYKVREL